MARNRRNIRKKGNIITDHLNMRNFLIIVGVLTIIIITCLCIYMYKQEQDRLLIAKQKEEMEKQSELIFTEIEDNIKQANQNISESDEIIKMSAVGDILCSEEMINDAYDTKSKTYDFSHMFSEASKYLEKSDIVMGTMETNFTTGKYNGENAPKEFAKAVKDSGINLVTITHNHSLDLGLSGLNDTKKLLTELGYSVVGDKIENSNAVIIKKVKNTNIAFLTYTYGVNYQSSKKKSELKAVNLYSEEQVKSDVKYAKDNGAEYICVMIHWGDAINETVSKSQKEMANFLVENGADIILGAHPSVVQPMEVRKNSEGKKVFIAYSIGTYISTLSDDNAKIELVLNIELRKSGKDGKVYLNKVNYTPIYVLDNGEKSENRFELVDMKATALEYANGYKEKITRTTYDKMVKGLKKLDNLLNKK